MPASSLFESFSKMNCTYLKASATFTISPPMISKLRRASEKKSREVWFAKAYEGEGKLKLGHSIGLRPLEKKNEYDFSTYWFMTYDEPPKSMGTIEAYLSALPNGFGEREVDVEVAFRFDKRRVSSLFRPFDLGEQSQILDEVVGFTGIKKDPKGKTLYRMNIAVTDETIEHRLYFRQTVKVSDDMAIPLVETANKISLLAVKPKEAQ